MKDYEDLKLKGWDKFFHECYVFMTYPLRHPFKSLIALAVLLVVLAVAIPLMQGVALKDLPKWYLNGENVQSVKEVILPKKISALKENSKKFAKKIKLKHVSVKSSDDEPRLKKEADEPKEEKIQYHVWNIKKEQSNRAKKEAVNKPVEEIVLKKEELIIEENPVIEKEPDIVLQEIIVEQKEPFESTDSTEPEIAKLFKKVDNLGLVYLDEPEAISGPAVVYGSNELYVDDTYLYLYGIWTNPMKYDASKAASYLRDFVGTNPIECYIVAKTAEDIATAVCLKSGQSINQHLVDVGLADNIAL